MTVLDAYAVISFLRGEPAADDVEADLALLTHAGMEIATLDATTAALAGRLRARHYHRERCAVSLADCVASATAIMHDRPLATADPALAAVLQAEHGKIVSLPDTNGQRP